MDLALSELERRASRFLSSLSIVLQGESDMALTALINASERPVGKSL